MEVDMRKSSQRARLLKNIKSQQKIMKKRLSLEVFATGVVKKGIGNGNAQRMQRNMVKHIQLGPQGVLT